MTKKYFLWIFLDHFGSFWTKRNNPLCLICVLCEQNFQTLHIMNDIKKLRRLMRTAHVLQKGDTDHKYSQSLALKKAWWFESFRDALTNGFARFTYYKKDGSTRSALGTRSPMLIPNDKAPKCPIEIGQWEDGVKSVPYFDLDKNEWRSFSVLNFVKLEQVWKFNNPQS